MNRSMRIIVMAALAINASIWAHAERRLFIQCNQASATVTWNGKTLGQTGPDGALIQNISNDGGTGTISKPGFEVFHFEAPPSPRGLDAPAVVVKLKRANVGELKKIVVSCNVGGATIELNGKRVAETDSAGVAVLPVTPGSYDLKVYREGFEPHEQRCVVRRTDFRATFTMLPASTSGNRGFGSMRLWMLGGVLLLVLGLLTTVLFLVLRRGSTQVFAGRYEVREVIGRGGMATIFKAIDRESKSQVALKIMDVSLMNDPDLVHKFLREGEIIQTLNQRAPEAPIVRVVDFGRESKTLGRPYIAMELLNGPTLMDQIKKRGPMSAEDAVRLITQVLEALIAAHDQGVYHRDLSPDNIIILDERGRNIAKLIDFGVARHEYTSAGTLDGSIMGKPPYMSPEQCKGEKVDGRSDLYSLGIILYTLLTGSPPYVAKNPLEVMRMHETGPVPEPPPGIPDGLAHALRRMLAKSREQRFTSAAEALHVMLGLGLVIND